MKSFKILLLSSLVLSACSQNNFQTKETAADETSKASVVGGRKVQAGDKEMAFIVGLYDTKNQFLCTGSLVASNLVLTAAHCIGDDPTKMVVIFKESFEESKKEDRRVVLSARKNPVYNENNIQGKDIGDIALIRFDPGTGIPAGYRTAKVLPDYNMLRPGTEVVVTGYGLNWSWVVSNGAGVLRTTTLEIENPNYATTEISLKQSITRGICSGDSGGPGSLLVNGELYIWGVVSRGGALNIPLTPKCAMMSIYTRIDSYKEWIIQTAQELNAEKAAQ